MGTPADTVNYSLFLQAIRDALDGLGERAGRVYGLTAALPCGPDLIGNIQIDIVSDILTELNLMTYDFHGWVITGWSVEGNTKPQKAVDVKFSLSHSMSDWLILYMCILLIVLLCLQTSNNSFYPTGHGTKRRVSMHPCMTWMEVQSFRYMAVLRIGRMGEGVLVKCECILSILVILYFPLCLDNTHDVLMYSIHVLLQQHWPSILRSKFRWGWTHRNRPGSQWVCRYDNLVGRWRISTV